MQTTLKMDFSLKVTLYCKVAVGKHYTIKKVSREQYMLNLKGL